MAKLTLTNITSGYVSTTAVNANNDLIEAALENTLSRDGTGPNTMNANLDMNGFTILNLGSLKVGGVDIGTQVSNAAASAASASTSASTATTQAGIAATQASNASNSAASAAASVLTVQDQKIIWQGPWNSGTTYAVNDAVSIAGSSYISILGSTNITPPNVTYWEILAEKGTPGAGTGDMLGANNLSDVANVSTALTNLGVSTFVKTIIDDVDAATVRGTIGAAALAGSASQAFSVAAPTSAAHAVRKDQIDVANSPLIATALNATGSAPIYACRAWVNFNGTGTVAIRASGNVSSITDNGTGNYTVNFTTAMPDANYSVGVSFHPFSGTNMRAQGGPMTFAAGSVTLLSGTSDTGVLGDVGVISVQIFR